MKKKYIRNSDLVWEKIDGELILLNYETGKIHCLNETAMAIWRFLKKERNIEEIYEYMFLNWDYDYGLLKKDVLKVITNMKKIGLISCT